MEEEQQRCTKNDMMRADVLDTDTTKCLVRKANDAVDLSVDKSINVDKEVKMVAKF